ncbi:unnamed protein product [Diabrotica balteata]|uniref:Chitin-binding type-2 domain-containing protein n=1 Tax=Diabrotica balteata TaxID=107213 RepID=A0A9N9XCP4_DIABA|nr:unnamed protein product [Diabrotica balteata]
MKGASVLFFLGICTNWALAVFLNHRPFPTYSLENMPDTSFSCRDKILGGYYADADAQCQMFHICVKVAGIGIQDFRFLCPNGTAFDQDHQICAEWEDIDCDATTLYYSSDNFDLYRLGSGFESKPHKYGEDEETLRSNELRQATLESTERDEDYDDNVNINQNQDYEQKRKVVRNKSRRPVQNRNEQNENNQNANRNNEYNRNQNNEYNRNQNNEYNRNNQNDYSRKENKNNDYNNRNNEYNRNQNNNYNRNQNNDNNRNQNNDYNRNQNNDYNRNQNTDYNRNQNTDYNKNQNTEFNRNQNNDYNRNQNNNTNNNDYNKNTQTAQTRRPVTKFTGFVNNFAGSYEPTTSRPTSTTLNSEQYSTAINNYKSRNGQRRPQTSEYTDSPVYTISTPAPFRQQQYNSPPSRSTNNAQYTSAAPKQSTNYDDNYDIPKVKSTVAQDYNSQYDIPKVKPASSTVTQYNTQKTTVSQYESTKTKPTFKSGSERTENYPSNNPKYTSNFEKKPTTPFKQNDNYPTTLNPKPFSVSNNNFPTTFAPRTNAAYSQIAQQTSTYNQNRQSSQNSPSSFNSTPKSTPFTQYTPTVPKLSSTTPVSRSSRFDETQYDDGSYSSKYDYDGDRRDDEFLKTAHSQNIAASRNELQRTSNNKQQQTTQLASQPARTTYDVPKTYPSTPKDVPRTNPSTSQVTKDTPRIYPSTAVTKDVPRTYQSSSQVTKDVPRTYPSTSQVTKDVPRTYPSTPQVTKDVPRTYPSTPQATKDVSRSFPSTPQATKDSSRTSQATESPKTSSQVVNKKPAPPKKDYDYAYYDTGVASEPDYEIDTEIKKSTVKN